MKPAANARALSIAGVDPERSFAGGESQVLGLTLALLRAGHRADLICDPAGELWRRARAAGVTCYPLRIRNSVDAAAGLKLRKFLARNHYDVVHFHTARAHALAPFAQGRARALIVTRRMDYAPNRLFAPWLYNRAVDGVAAISPAVAEVLVRAGVARDRVGIIASGVDCDRWRPPSASERAAARGGLGLADGQIAVGTIGMLEARKGHRYLIDAMASLGGITREAGREIVPAAETTREDAPVAVKDASVAATDAPVAAKDASVAVKPAHVAVKPAHVAVISELRCFIAGGGSLTAELSEQIRKAGLDHSTRMMGMIDDSRALLWALDIFTLPSLREGLGVAALEAMACGLPVVASATGGLAQTVVDGVTGILVAAGDAPALARAIAGLAADAPLRAAMGAAGRARVCESYGMEAMARGTLELYRACLHNRASTRR